MTTVIKKENEKQEEELSQEEADELQRQYYMEQEQAAQQQEEESEEQLIQKARRTLNQIETEGKKYFKPKDGVTYRLTFDRVAALNVIGQPSAKLTREVKDKKTGEVINEVPVLEWVYEVTHISGNVQTWSVTSKITATRLLNQLIAGKSVLDVTKHIDKDNPFKTEYEITGVS